MDRTRALAHEIQASLLAVEARLESLRGVDGADDAVSACRAELHYLRQVIAGVLGSDAPPPPLVPTRIAPILARVVARFSPVVGASRFVVELDDTDLTVAASPPATERILTALVENAVRHGDPRGAITLRARRTGVAVEVLVEDEGPGVEDFERERVFEPGARGDEHGAGAGLGLAIARRLAQAQGAALTLEPSPAGSRFALRWSPA